MARGLFFNLRIKDLENAVELQSEVIGTIYLKMVDKLEIKIGNIATINNDTNGL